MSKKKGASVFGRLQLLANMQPILSGKSAVQIRVPQQASES
jgi:hypothetical protein